MRTDPAVRRDGCCVECGKPRKITKISRKYAGDQVAMDPFCSTECCRRWHGTMLANVGSPARAEGGRVARDIQRAKTRWVDRGVEDEREMLDELMQEAAA